MPCPWCVTQRLLRVARTSAFESSAASQATGCPRASGVCCRKGRAGTSRLSRRLKQLGHKGGRHQVAQSLRRQGLRAKGARKYKATTNSKHSLPVAPNLLQQDFSAVRPNQKWASDITYIWTEEGWLYLAVVLDLYSRLVVGWSLSDRMTATWCATHCAWPCSGANDRVA